MLHYVRTAAGWMGGIGSILAVFLMAIGPRLWPHEIAPLWFWIVLAEAAIWTVVGGLTWSVLSD